MLKQIHNKNIKTTIFSNQYSARPHSSPKSIPRTTIFSNGYSGNQLHFFKQILGFTSQTYQSSHYRKPNPHYIQIQNHIYKNITLHHTFHISHHHRINTPDLLLTMLHEYHHIINIFLKLHNINQTTSTLVGWDLVTVIQATL